MRRLLGPIAIILMLCMSVVTQADVFDMGPGLTSLRTVVVGDPGNIPDTRQASIGTVDYSYRMGTFEVTSAQYTQFLNAVAGDDRHGLYSSYMFTDPQGCRIQCSGDPGHCIYSVAADQANRPVNFVNYMDACRFANWLQNGQPCGAEDSSTTEDGAYNLTNPDAVAYGLAVRNPCAKWFIPSEDEWYKAAYYKGGGTSAGYWNNPTQSNSEPHNDVAGIDPGNNANFKPQNSLTLGSPYYRTEVGEFENSESAYGTFDQGGNVWEWTETNSGNVNTLRGGSYLTSSVGEWLFTTRHATDERFLYDIGFRVAAADTPEPCTPAMFVTGGAGIAFIMRRRRAI